MTPSSSISDSDRPSRRWPGRLARWALALLLVLPPLVAALALAALQLAPVRARILAALTDELAQSGIILSVTGAGGWWPVSFSAGDLTLADAKGPFFTAHDIALAWRPAALLKGQIEIQTLSAASASLLRAPDLPPGTDSGEDAGAAWLTRLRIDRIDLPRLSVGEDVAGVPLQLALTGGQQEDSIAFHFTGRRVGEETARLSLDSLYRPADNHLTLTGLVEEPAGGLHATLTGMPRLGALTARLSGAGTLPQFHGQLDGALEGQGSLDALLDIAPAGDAISITLSAGMKLDHPPAGFETLPHLDLALTLTDDAITLARPLELETGWGRARLEGRLGRAEPWPMALEGALDLPDLARVPFLSGASGGLTASLSAHGDLDAPRLDLKASSTQLRYQDFRAAALEASLAGPAGGPLALELDLAAPALDGTPLSDYGLTDPRLTATLLPAPGAVTLQSLSLQAGDVTLSGKGKLEHEAGTLALALEAAHGGLAPLLAQAGLPGHGHGAASLTLDGDYQTGPLDFALEARLDDLTLDDADLAALLGPAPALTLSGTWTPARVKLARADLAFAAGALSAGGTLADDALALTFQGDSALPAATGGHVQMQGKLAGTAAQPELALQLALEKLKLPISALHADLTATAADKGWQGTVTLDDLPEWPGLTLASPWHFDNGRLDLTALDLKGEGVAITGAAALQDGTPRADLDIARLDLARLAPLTGQPLAGMASGKLRLDDTRLSGEMSVADPGLPGQAAADRLTVKLEEFDIAGLQSGHAALHATALALPGDQTAPVADLDLTARKGVLAATLIIPPGGSGPAIDAAASFDPAKSRLKLERAELALRGNKASLIAPATLTLAPAPMLDKLALDITPAGQLRASGRLDPEKLDFHASASDLPITLLRALGIYPGVTGTLAATLNVTGNSRAPHLDAAIHVPDLRFLAPSLADRPPSQLEAGLQADGKRTRLDLSLGDTDGAMQLALNLPRGFDPRQPLPPGDTKLEGSLKGSLSLAGLDQYVPDIELMAAGNLSADLALSGTLAAPAATGPLTLADGRLELLQTGLLLDPLNARLQAEGRTLRLVALTALDGGPGWLEGKGQLDLAERKAEIALDLNDFHLTRLDMATLAASGRSTLKGGLDRLRLSGKLEVTRGELRIPDHLPPDIRKLEVENVGLPPIPAVARTPAPEFAIDLLISIPGRLFVTGRGLQSEWKGLLTLITRKKGPEMFGVMSLVRGRLDFLGQDFTLDEGRLQFDGGQDPDPAIAVAASVDADDITATVAVEGRVSSPRFRLSSTPALPQDEILARILFGKSADGLTAAEAVQLASGLATLSGAAGGTSIMDRMRRSLGVDTLRVGGGSDGASLSVGRYLSDDVFISVDQGLTPESSRVRVEIDLTDQIQLDTFTGATGDVGIGAEYHFDY